MKATHINYLHPKHLRVIDYPGQGNKIVCMAPSHSQYSKLAGKALPDYSDKP